MLNLDHTQVSIAGFTGSYQLPLGGVDKPSIENPENKAIVFVSD